MRDLIHEPASPVSPEDDDFWGDFRIQRTIDSRMGISARRDSRSRLSERILNELTGTSGELLPNRTEAEDRLFWATFFDEAKRLSEESRHPRQDSGAAA